MRALTDGEAILIDDNGEGEEGATLQEATIKELGDLGYGTRCGRRGNTCFSALAKQFGDRLVRGWMNASNDRFGPSPKPTVWGMVHIQCTEEEGETIEEIASAAEGSLRFDSPESDGSEFCIFEIE